ncbi:hypothetical protein BDB01DRAFT_845941 [Pilobolus umbonatus]|nr:hypothetical protein BDB01DRAFT_845941 [Pilobolus umbonatus]
MSDYKSNILESREKALENEYIRKKEQEQLKALKASLDKKEKTTSNKDNTKAE